MGAAGAIRDWRRPTRLSVQTTNITTKENIHITNVTNTRRSDVAAWNTNSKVSVLLMFVGRGLYNVHDVQCTLYIVLNIIITQYGFPFQRFPPLTLMVWATPSDFQRAVAACDCGVVQEHFALIYMILTPWYYQHTTFYCDSYLRYAPNGGTRG